MESGFLSAGVRSGLDALKGFDQQFRATSQRLATGLRVNRASDDPTAFFTARALSNRASDLNRVLDGISTRLGSARVANAGLRAIEGLVRIAQVIVDAAAAVPEPQPTATGTVDVASQSDVTALAGVSDGDQFSVQVGADAAVTVTVSAGDTPDDLLAQLNAIDNVSASFAAGGELQIVSTNGGDLTLTEVSGAPLAGLGITPGSFDASTGTSPERAALAAEFDALRGQ